MTNKTVFITGTSTGIGRATAELFLAKGWNVAATMRQPEQETVWQPSERLLIAGVDVTKSETIGTALNSAIAKFGKIDVVVNNAGYGLLGPLELSTEEQVRQQYETNVFGTINVMRAIIPHFREQGGGRIINVSSMLGRITLPFMSMYASTKWAVEAVSEAMWYELDSQNISVKVIEPGTINTDFFGRSLQTTTSTTVHTYQSYWEKVIKNFVTRGQQGADPIVAAKVIYRAATDGKRKFRYTVDRTAKLLLLARRTSPLWFFRWVSKASIQ
jgi:NAD(P)-dependent dehydrogenase (short-subunit alcohol dehydrogenase family)